jgi:GGDEF domain-containing protein
VLVDVGDADLLRAAEGRIRAAFIEPFMLGEVTLQIGASVGGSLWPEDGQSINELVTHADEAMYQDKTGVRPAVA